MTRRLRAVVLALAAALIALAAVILALNPPGGTDTATPGAGSREVPSAVAGQPVPAITGTPAVRLAAAGDTGTGTNAERATVQTMVAQGRAEPYDGLLLLGDLIYDDGDPARLDAVVTEPFAPVLDTGVKLLPVLGNHDIRSGRQQDILSALGRDRSWYVERLGPLKIVVLDSNRVRDPAQTRWLRDTLAAEEPPGTWTIAAMHHPAYSAGRHGSDPDVQRTWAPLFSQYGVRLALAGHDHDYERSQPQGGVTYVVSGAGAKLRPVGRADFTAVSASTLHYLDLLVYDDRLVGRAIDHSGTLIDAFTITR
jgi:3',5'-cyclic AMP phosphodiesterase CpdA